MKSISKNNIHWFAYYAPICKGFDSDGEFGTVESVKAVAELYMPIDGEVIQANQALEDAPELLNNSPYSDG